MREMRQFVNGCRASRIGVNTKKSNLSVLIVTLIGIHRARRLAETLAVALAGVDRFELCLLSRRNEVRVFFQILDDFFRDNFSLETPQRAFD